MATKRQRHHQEEEELMEEHARWDELAPDALAQIFSKVPMFERLTVLPRVCKSWSHALTLPLCWQVNDLLPLTNCQFHSPQPSDQIERTVQMLVARSCGTLRTLSVYGLQSDSIFTFIAQNAGCLGTLMIPGSMIGDYMMEHIAGRLSSVTFIDVSYCINMGARGLEVIGNNCKLLQGLCRKMDLWDIFFNPPRDDEAMAIASTMPNLKHLDIEGHSMTTEGVCKILAACSNLEYLYISGCDHVDAQNLGLSRKKLPKILTWRQSTGIDCKGT